MTDRPRRRKGRAADFVSGDIPSGPAAPRSVRTKPVRVTLDLAPPDHAALKRWCHGAALDLDLSDVPLAAVLRVLGKRLLDDPALAATVRTALAEQAGQ